jgi:anti-anti-sigma factor
VNGIGMGFLVRLEKSLRRSGRRVVLVGPSKAMHRALKRFGLREFFLTSPNLPASIRLLDSCANEQCVPVALRTALNSNLITWRGEITSRNSKEVWMATERQLCRARKLDWVIDLSRVRHIDSSGVEAMLRVERLAGEHGATVSFVRAGPAVRNTLRFARGERLLRRRPAPRRREMADGVGLVLARHA